MKGFLTKGEKTDWRRARVACHLEDRTCSMARRLEKVLNSPPLTRARSTGKSRALYQADAQRPEWHKTQRCTLITDVQGHTQNMIVIYAC